MLTVHIALHVQSFKLEQILEIQFTLLLSFIVLAHKFTNYPCHPVSPLLKCVLEMFDPSLHEPGHHASD